MLPGFIAMLNGVAWDDLPSPDEGSYLFPRCVVCPGVNHICDNIIKDSMHRLPWFVPWLRGVKALCRILSTRIYKEAVASYLRLHGFWALANQIMKFKSSLLSGAGTLWSRALLTWWR